MLPRLRVGSNTGVAHSFFAFFASFEDWVTPDFFCFLATLSTERQQAIEPTGPSLPISDSAGSAQERRRELPIRCTSQLPGRLVKSTPLKLSSASVTCKKHADMSHPHTDSSQRPFRRQRSARPVCTTREPPQWGQQNRVKCCSTSSSNRHTPIGFPALMPVGFCRFLGPETKSTW